MSINREVVEASRRFSLSGKTVTGSELLNERQSKASLAIAKQRGAEFKVRKEMLKSRRDEPVYK
jgi:hypothetical protein